MKLSKTQARLQFMAWVKDNYPELYLRAQNTARKEGSEPSAQLAGLGEGFWEKFSSTVTGLGTTYLTLKNQRDAMKLNMQRAEQGLPPVDAGVTAPVIRTQIDLPPDVINRISSEAGMNVNKILIFGAAAIAALFFFKKK